MDELLYVDSSIDFESSFLSSLCDYIDNFDIDSLPKEIRDKIYNQDYYDIDYDWDIDRYYELPYDEYITEENSIIQHMMDKLAVRPKIKIDENVPIMSARDLCSHLKNKYGAFIKSIKKTKPNKQSIYNIVNVELLCSFVNNPFISITSGKSIKNNNITNLDVFDKDCYSNGYYRIRTSLKTDRDGNKFYFSVYNPIRDESIREQLRGYVDNMYHLAPIEIRDSILEKGIITSPGQRLYSYKEPRAFFITLPYTNQKYLSMMSKICKESKERDKTLSGIYDIWLVDLNELPEEIDLFLDINRDDCVFSKETIKPEHLIHKGTIDLNEPFDPRKPKVTLLK